MRYQPGPFGIDRGGHTKHLTPRHKMHRLHNVEQRCARLPDPERGGRVHRCLQGHVAAVDAIGRLKPVRRPGSGYRFYRRPDLEPFRLEYRRAEQAVDEPNHMFQALTADIEGNPNIREPQQGAHRAVRTHFDLSNEPVIVQIPVGCGKTGVIATLPFGIAKGRALVIAPNLTIRSGVADSLDISNPKNFWRKTGAIHDFSAGPFRTVLDGLDANLHDCNASQFVIANIHQLASAADRWLPQFPPNYFDMIIVDEGHHNVAPSWAKVFDRFPNAKVVSLTATPFRSDGTRPVGKVIYRYPFTRAMVKGYIKQIHSRNVAPSELSFTYRDDTKRHSLEEVLALRENAWFRRGVALAPECNRHIVDASIKYLYELRQRSGFHHQMIAVACSVDHARQVRGFIRNAVSRPLRSTARWTGISRPLCCLVCAEVSLIALSKYRCSGRASTIHL